MASALYTVDILRLATNIPCLGRLESPHGSSERRSPVCGSKIAVDVCVDASGQVIELGQIVSACALGQAAANLMAHRALGMRAGELETLSQEVAAWLAGSGPAPADWADLLVLARAVDYPARHGAIRLPFEAVAEAAARAAVHA